MYSLTITVTTLQYPNGVCMPPPKIVGYEFELQKLETEVLQPAKPGGKKLNH
jgi:hypothetical protein